MNEFLQNKLNELQDMQKGACWYIVKQETSFVALCYLVDFLQEYQNTSSQAKNLEQFIKSKAERLNQSLHLNITTTHRALRVAVFFGLITNSNPYEQSQITSVYNEIKQRCNGKFEDIQTYQDIVQRQIEKMFISSEIDEQFESTRSEYRLYPVMLLYKILLELYLSGQDPKISDFEYRYFVATTKTFEGFLDTLLLIQSLRQDDDKVSIERQFIQYKEKVDNRLIQALKQLETLDFSESGYIKLKIDRIKEIAQKLYFFEQDPSSFNKDNYGQFLQSDSALIPLSSQSEQSDPQNLLLYGVAGVGKSYYVNQQLNNLNGENEHRIERVVFHPDYLNADFIGQILPTVKKDVGITYEFKAGPFTRILKKAFDNPDQHHYLVIEEINRGNAPAIFGEIFQLLDRNSKGESEYKISNDLIAGFINDTLDQNSDSKVSNGNLKIQNNMIYIPSNLSIYATMNTADQNVFTLDTAFQRRWTMQMMENNIEQCGFRNVVIGDTGVTWDKFNTELNTIILQSNKNTLSSEDKRLGAYFVKPHELTIQDGSCPFAEKVIKYLWDDVFKFKKSELFRDDLDSLDQVLKEFNNGVGSAKFNIFIESVRQSLLSSPKPSTEDVADASGEFVFADSKDENE
ncbi:AAA family ATPase [Moraxella sp. FZFQ2102]|uniref:McrB family protein n=1 Tax=Moraxella sp. FZFQ2102 TaxID=2953752 RepID=UPI00209C1231|nr:AAA family ATPase [Moraxella sp. FZFQ2102]USZ15071.1 AAA family ATPase [Moraxella sp. FZFQ2102]